MKSGSWGTRAVLKVDGEIVTLGEYSELLIARDCLTRIGVDDAAVDRTLGGYFAHHPEGAVLVRQVTAGGEDALAGVEASAQARAVLPFLVLEDLAESTLLRQLAPSLGVEVAEEEIQAFIRTALAGGDAAETSLPSWKDCLDALGALGLREAVVRDYVSAELLRRKISHHFVERVSNPQLQVRCCGVLCERLEDAGELRKRVAAGATLASLASSKSIDEESRTRGGDLGWFPRGTMAATVEEWAFSARVDSISAPIAVAQGWWVLQLVERRSRKLGRAELDHLAEADLRLWLNRAKDEHVVERFFDSRRYAWATRRWQDALVELGVEGRANAGSEVAVVQQS